MDHAFVRVWALWIDRDAEVCATICHSAKDIIGQALIESPRFVAAIVANIKSFGAAIPQVTRGVGQRIHGIKEANYVWFRFSVIVILAHEVEQAVISLVVALTAKSRASNSAAKRAGSTSQTRSRSVLRYWISGGSANDLVRTTEGFYDTALNEADDA